MVKHKALPDPARLCCTPIWSLSLSPSLFLSLAIHGDLALSRLISCVSSLSLSLMLFILRVPHGSCRGLRHGGTHHYILVSYMDSAEEKCIMKEF